MNTGNLKFISVTLWFDCETTMPDIDLMGQANNLLVYREVPAVGGYSHDVVKAIFDQYAKGTGWMGWMAEGTFEIIEKPLMWAHCPMPGSNTIDESLGQFIS